ncbi:unnamed protein product [Didymodactylos carnosus]|uniref:Uncharacterized protein n=1 Tax=Didymodactylos carnosus TaxID=1234261 RepID=A0A815ISK7_9BILA|nr:unnamed protein product [Didymodactylos carnosus]CAF4254730.1 unnamed protein product [Didymodactylos carnosus]
MAASDKKVESVLKADVGDTGKGKKGKPRAKRKSKRGSTGKVGKVVKKTRKPRKSGQGKKKKATEEEVKVKAQEQPQGSKLADPRSSRKSGTDNYFTSISLTRPTGGSTGSKTKEKSAQHSKRTSSGRKQRIKSILLVRNLGEKPQVGNRTPDSGEVRKRTDGFRWSGEGEKRQLEVVNICAH